MKFGHLEEGQPQLGDLRSPWFLTTNWDDPPSTTIFPMIHHILHDFEWQNHEVPFQLLPSVTLDRSPKWRSQKNPNPWKNKTTNNLKEPMCWHICVFCCFKNVNHQPVLPFLTNNGGVYVSYVWFLACFFLNRRCRRKFHLSLCENQLGWRKATN